MNPHTNPIEDPSLPADRRALLAGITGLAAGAFLASSRSAHAGPLSPPAGPVSSTTGPEPRTAINDTNTPGDADSVFKISQPGSYYLTANVQGAISKHGIKITTSNVTIDLNGFTLLGVLNSLAGIFALNSFVSITIRNGTIRDWGASGISLLNCTQCRLEHLSVNNCVGNGFNLGSRLHIHACVATSNSAAGISANFEAVIDSCATFLNSTDGISIGAIATVTNCVSRGNGASGIRSITNGYSSITDNTVTENTADGIRTLRGCTIARNTCAFNTTNIRVTSGDNRIEDNLCVNGTTGIAADFSGNIIIKNTCSGNTTNWALAANNVFGPIVDRSAPASAAVTGNSAPSSLATTDPNANFTF